MTPIPESLLVLSVMLAAGLLGTVLRRLLPKSHLTDGTPSHLTATIAVVATLTALVLGLAISNANTARVGMINDLALLSSDIVRTDDLLRRFGPAANNARADLIHYAVEKQEDLFPRSAGREPNPSNSQTAAILGRVQDEILKLEPQDDAQRWEQSQALVVSTLIVVARWTIAEQGHTVVSEAGEVVLVFWLSILFGTYGLFMPRHVTAFVGLLLSATAVASAIFLILDARAPFSGMFHVSSETLSEAVRAVRS